MAPDNTGVLKSPHGASKNTINEFPLIEFAYLSNTKISKSDEEMSESTTINFNPIHLNWCNFQLLFFTPCSKFFVLNQANIYTNALSFNQTYQDITNKTVPFSLYTSVLNDWAVKNNLSTASIPTFKKIDLSKQNYLINSLANIRGSVSGLSLNECIDLLVKNCDIIYTGDEDTYATVDFVLVFRYDYLPLNTSINLNFHYRTNIPSYINNTCDPTPYSNDSDSSCKNLYKMKEEMNTYDSKHKSDNNNKEINYNIMHNNGYGYDSNSILPSVHSNLNENKNISSIKNDYDHISIPSQNSISDEVRENNLISAGKNIITAVEEIVSKYIHNTSTSIEEEESTVNWGIDKDDESNASTIDEKNPMHKN